MKKSFHIGKITKILFKRFYKNIFLILNINIKILYISRSIIGKVMTTDSYHLVTRLQMKKKNKVNP